VVGNSKPSILIRDYLMYWKVDPKARVAAQKEWNSPQYWPLAMVFALLAALFWIAVRAFRARERAVASPAARLEGSA
jgi:cytoskeletal protein RodZ